MQCELYSQTFLRSSLGGRMKRAHKGALIHAGSVARFLPDADFFGDITGLLKFPIARNIKISMQLLLPHVYCERQLIHIKSQHELRCFCPLLSCRFAVSGRGHGEMSIGNHMAKHAKFGHFVGLDNPSPTQRHLPKEVLEKQAELGY